MTFKLTLSFWVRLALAISLIYHGSWNLSQEGQAWWSTAESPFPPMFRYLIGLGEVAAAVSFLTNQKVRLAALCLIPIFIGAIFVHLGDGFSYKKGGIEVPLIYLLLAVGLAGDRNSRIK